MSKKRPPFRIRFKYNIDTGDVEEFIIDDNARAASESYHDKVANQIASKLARNPDVLDAGMLRQVATMPAHINQDNLMEEDKKQCLNQT